MWTFENVNIPPAGDIALSSTKGLVKVTDIGDNKIAGLPSQTWGLLINFKAKAWVFGYEGGGKLSLSIDDNGNLTPGGNGTVTEISYNA